MNTLIQKFLALFSTTAQDHPVTPGERPEPGGMPLASPAYLREFAQRLGLEVDDLSPAERSELKHRLDGSMDFREENYRLLYHEVYQLGHGYSLADAKRVSAKINSISEEASARAYLDYRENAVAAEALMAAGTLLQHEGENNAAERLFSLAEDRRHRSSLLGRNDSGEFAAGLQELMDDGAGDGIEPDAAEDVVPQDELSEDVVPQDELDDGADEADKPAR